jgi:SAM-dependent methyltransferase
MTQADSYFSLRNVDAATYRDFKLPAYLRDVLTDRHARILDFGCGFGQLLSALRQEQFSQIEGADIDSAAIARLREQGFVVHDLAHTEDFYARHEGAYDHVIMSHVLEHFPKAEIISRLKQIRRLLATQGKIIVMVPNAQSNTGCYWAYEDFTHHMLFTTGSLYYVLRAAGFTKIEFLDVDCTAGLSPLKQIARKTLLALYRGNLSFWNKVTGSAFHAPSPQVFSYEIKVVAQL